MTLRDRFTFFVDVDCNGTSLLYERLGRKILDDPAVLDVLPDDTNPVHLFAAINRLGGMSDDYGAFRMFLIERADEILALVANSAIQTNEIGRCSAILPALAMIDGPIALVEVGASGGLNLLLDRYAYDYGFASVGSSPVRIVCEASGPVPVPRTLPEIVWRKGIDRTPIDLGSDDEVAWLEACVFADNVDRVERLRAAVELAREDPPDIVRGDLVDRLADVVTEAPKDATTVLINSAVLPYLEAEHLARFQALVADLGIEWLSLEAWFFLEAPRKALSRRGTGLNFVLSRNGREPLAFAHPHGRWLEWF